MEADATKDSLDLIPSVEDGDPFHYGNNKHTRIHET